MRVNFGVREPGKRRGVGGKGWAVAGTTALFLGSGTNAQAHTPIQGLGEIANGLLHPLLTPTHVLVLVALGFLLGQQRPLQLARPLAVFAAAAAAGLLVTTTGAITNVLTPVLMLLALPLGALVALALPLPSVVRLVFCAAAALVLGLDSSVETGTLAVPAAKTLLANEASLVLCVVNVAFYVSLLPGIQWVQTGVRIVGSWIVAIALLMMAFALKQT